MDGTPHLLTDVKFSERRKGYDPDEVDNFLERVSAAVAQLQDKLRDATTKAEEADARINEAKRNQAVAESQVDQLKADLHQAQANAPAAAPVVSSANDAEKASALLVMAQKTADAAVEDARRKADTTLTEARAAATTLVGDAEADADRIRSDARRIADDMVEQKRAAARAEVAALEELKGQIQFDVDVLQRHVDEERSGLRNALARLGELVEDPAAFRISAPPAVSAPSAATIVEDSPAAGVEAIDEVDDVDVEAELEGEPTDEAATEAVEPEATERPEPLFAAEPDDEVDQPGPPTEAFQPFPEPDAAPEGKASEDQAPAGDKPAGGSTEGDKSEGLGTPNADEDQAMRAFFETDFDTEGEEKRSRWRR